MGSFKWYEYEDLTEPVCPHCGAEVSDVGNGGDPRSWWHVDNIPDGHFSHKCESCGEKYYIGVSWRPWFTVKTEEYYLDHESDDFDGLEEA